MSLPKNMKELCYGIKLLVREEVQPLRVPLQRVLLFVLLDSLGKVVCPTEKGSKKRFVQLIQSYSRSREMDYVSLDRLYAKLMGVKASSDLKSAIEAKITKRPKDVDIFCRPDEVDLCLDQLRVHDPCGRAQEQIEMARYTSLLWQKRNLQIHDLLSDELALLDDLINVKDKTRPRYHLTDGGWVLYFPTPSIFKLLDDCLDNLISASNAEKR